MFGGSGVNQLEVLRYDETFSIIDLLEEIHLFLAYASFINFTVYQVYIKTTFLHGALQEEVFL